MQDIHSIGSGGGGGRLFGGGGDRRLRPHHHQHQQGHAHQALKCPRCESLNTKFCYYNNYNLSQPRHFCKSCRRYWTKGGVLRNVPVGGGCRKTKRSKPKTSNNNNQTSDAAASARELKSSNSQNSSSDSSSLTANTSAAKTTATTPTAVTEVLSGNNSTNSSRMLFKFQESSTRFFNIPQTSTPNQSFEPPMLENSSADNILPEIGPFTSMMTSFNDQLPLGFNMASDISSFRLHQQGQVQGVEYQNSNERQWVQQTESMVGDGVKMQEMSGGGFMDDHTFQIELSGLQNRTSNGGLSTEDWQGGTDQALFDLTGTVDQSYWNQNQWNDQDHQLNFLP